MKMIIKTNINSSSIVIQGTFSALLLVSLWSLISHRFVIALTTLEADKINDKPSRASYYAGGLLQQPPLSPPIDISHSIHKKGHNRKDVTQREAAAAGAVMPHQLIYELAIEHKHITRVSLLTCQHGSPLRRLRKQTTTASINIDTLTILRTSFTGKDNRPYRGSTDHRHFDQFSPKGILIKVLRIDLLINSQAGEGAANKRHSDVAAVAVILEAFLRSEVLRQVVVLDLSCGHVSRKVIEIASNKGLFNSSYHWLLIEDYVFNRRVDDDDFQLPQDIVTADATNTTPTPATGSTGASDGSKSKDNKINNDGDDVDDNKVASDSNDNVEENNLLIEKFLEKINININTELILAKRINGDQDSKEDYYMLYDVWSPGLHYGGSLNITKIGNFTRNAGLQFQKWYRQATTVTRRMDMKNARIRGIIVVTNKNRIDSLEDYLTRRYDTHLDSMHRFNFNLLLHVRDLFNFSLVMSRTPSWGYLKNGKFDGMIGALVRREADIGGSPTFFRIERAKVIDYTARTWIARPCFIFRHPRTLRTDNVVFLQPFSNDAWVLVAVCGGLSVALLAALTIVERRFTQESHNSSVVVEERLAHGKGRRKRNVKSKHNHNHGTNNARRRGKKRQIDIEVSSFTQRNALPLARNGILKDVALRFRSTGGDDATTLDNERFHTRAAATHERGHVPADYGGGIFERSAIYCTDYGVGVSGPRDAIPHNNNRSGGRRGGCKESFKHWKKYCIERNNNRLPSIRKLEMIQESLIFYIGSICQQGLSFSTNLLSGRCIVITSLLFSFFIYQFYSASIVGTLLMEKQKTIKTLRDVVHSSLEIGIEDIVYNRDYFLKTRDPDAIELYAKKAATGGPYSDIPAPTGKLNTNTTKWQVKINNESGGSKARPTEALNWYNPVDGVAKVKQGGFAFHVDVATAYKIISDTFTEREICDLTEIELFAPQKAVGIVQKGSPLRKIITYGLRRASETGLMDRERKAWLSPKPRCVKQINPDDLHVDMQTFTSAVFVLIFGFAASIVVLALEMVHNNLWQYSAT